MDGFDLVGDDRGGRVEDGEDPGEGGSVDVGVGGALEHGECELDDGRSGAGQQLGDGDDRRRHGGRLSVTKSDSPDPVLADDDLAYTIVGRERPPSDCGRGVGERHAAGELTDETFCEGAACDPSAVGPGRARTRWAPSRRVGSKTVKIRAKADPSTSGSAVLSNTASLSSTTDDPAPGNNSATATTDVDTAADLSMTKSDSPDPVLAGNI